MSLSTEKAGLKVADEKRKTLEGNVYAQNNPARTTKKVELQPVVTSGRVTSLRSHISRNWDPYRLQEIRNFASTLDRSKAIFDSSAELRAQFEDVAAGESPKLVEAHEELIRNLTRALNDPTNDSVKTNIVESANRLANTLSESAKICLETRFKSQERISENIDSLNTNLSELSNVNRMIAQEYALGSDISNLEDMRDDLINRISSSIAVETPTIAHNGTVHLRSETQILVSDEHYAQFQFSPKDRTEVNNGAYSGNISYFLLDNHDNKINFSEVIFDKENDDDRLPKGFIRGNMDLYNDVIPSYQRQLNLIAYNLREHINKIHNTATNHGGRNFIEGQTEFSIADRNAWEGVVRIGLTDREGNAPRVEEDIHPDAFLDLGGLTRVSENSSITAEDISNEINELFKHSHHKKQGMGKQSEHENKYLLHDLRAIVTNNNNSNINFDFEALNTSDFGAKLEILDVSVPSGSRVLGHLPESSNIERGAKARTFNTVTIDKGTLTGEQGIEVTVRVIGDNGQVNQGIIRYNINFDTHELKSKRISGEGIGGDFETTSLHTKKMIESKILDDSGNKVRHSGILGHFSLNSVHSEYGISIQDETSVTNSWDPNFGFLSRGFSHFYGLNNLFDVKDMSSDKESSKNYALNMSVRDDILKDSDLLSTSRLREASQKTTSLKIGTKSAEASIEFTSDNSADYDEAKITIAGKEFELKNGGVTSVDEIDISSSNNRQEILDKIVNRLNNDRYFSSFISFERIGNELVINAQNAGEDGNNIEYQFEGNNPVFDIGQGAVNDTGNHNLTGGVSEEQEMNLPVLGKVTTAGYRGVFKDLLNLENTGVNYFIHGRSAAFRNGTLSALTKYGVKEMSKLSEKITREKEVYEKALETSSEKYKNDFGFNEDQHVADLVELANWKSLLTFSTRERLNSDRELIQAMMR